MTEDDIQARYEDAEKKASVLLPLLKNLRIDYDAYLIRPNLLPLETKGEKINNRGRMIFPDTRFAAILEMPLIEKKRLIEIERSSSRLMSKEREKAKSVLNSYTKSNQALIASALGTVVTAGMAGLYFFSQIRSNPTSE